MSCIASKERDERESNNCLHKMQEILKETMRSRTRQWRPGPSLVPSANEITTKCPRMSSRTWENSGSGHCARRAVARFGIRDDVWEILDRARSPGHNGQSNDGVLRKNGVEADLILRSDWWEGNEDVVVFERITPLEPASFYTMTRAFPCAVENLSLKKDRPSAGILGSSITWGMSTCNVNGNRAHGLQRNFVHKKYNAT